MLPEPPPDPEGHLALRADGTACPGLCHCARNEAHLTDPADKPAYDQLWTPPGAPDAAP